MWKKYRAFWATIVSLGILAACAHGPVAKTEEVQRIDKERLCSMLGTPGVVVLDVRLAKSKQKIWGAVHEDPRTVNTWADKYPIDTTLVLYCS